MPEFVEPPVEYLRGIELELHNAYPDKFILIVNSKGEYEYNINLLMKMYAIGYSHLKNIILRVINEEKKKKIDILFFVNYNEN